MTSTTPIGSPSAFQRWRRATLAPFATPAFALFWGASLVSSFGSLIQTVGASWLMATIAPSADRVALVQTAGALPFFFLSLIAGALADTHDRRKLMLFSQGLMIVASAALAVFTLAGEITPSLLLLFTFLIGCGAAAFAPAWQASIGEQVPRTQIPSAIMANAMGFNLARSIGPAIGGIIVALSGAGVAFVINAFSYIGMIATLLWWRPARPRNPLPPEPLGSAILAGVRYVRLSPQMMALLLRCLLFSLPVAVTPALMPIVARDLLGGGARTYGLLLGAFGVGAMLGALSSASVRSRFAIDGLLRTLSVLSCISMLTIAVSPWPLLTFLAHLLAGSVWTLGLANFNIAVQLSSPRWVTGRTLATYQTVAFAGLAFGSWIWGQLAHAAGLRETYGIAAACSLVALVVARWSPVSVSSLGSLDPQIQAEVRAPHVEIGPESGPIVVTIEYQVEAARAVEFIAVANEVGRIRRRDGARAWSICQDIDQPELWVERFESPTWLDYLRRQSRPTKADHLVRERLASLIASERGTVRRLIERPAGSEPLGPSRSRDEPVDEARPPS